MTIFVNEWNDAGELADWTDVGGAGYSVADGDLIGAGSNQQLIRTGVEPAGAAFIEAEISTHDDGGLVLRYVDDSNHYLMAVRDRTGSFTSLQLYRKESGSYTSLTTVTGLSIFRGDDPPHVIRFEAVPTVGGNQWLRCFVDGVLRIERFDDTYTTGGLGVRTGDTPTRWQSITGGDLVVAPDIVDAFRGFVYPLSTVLPPEFYPDGANPIHNGNTIIAAFPAGAGGGAPTNPTHGYATSG